MFVSARSQTASHCLCPMGGQDRHVYIGSEGSSAIWVESPWHVLPQEFQLGVSASVSAVQPSVGPPRQNLREKTLPLP